MDTPYTTKAYFTSAIITIVAIIGVNMYVVRSFGFSWISSLYDALIGMFIWLSGAVLIGNTLRFFFPRQSRFTFLGALVFCATALYYGLVMVLTPLVMSNTTGYMVFFESSITLRLAFTMLLFTAVSMVFALLIALGEQQQADKRRSEVAELARQTELNNLQEKLQPHFLFNSLNSINALVVRQPEKARLMVQQLSDFLRGTLKRDEATWISLQQEMDYLQLYLDIEKVRFGHRLQTTILLQNNAGQASIPPFILLPLLENAIKFGLYDTLDDIEIKLQADVQENLLTIQIANPYDAETAIHQKGTGFGLRSVQRRLHLLFERTDLMQTRAEAGIFTTQVQIPQITPTGDGA
jgi:LytS/YehU family sensor histidine kinase